MNIHYLVESIVKKYHTRNPFKIVEEMRVILVYAPLVDIRGFYQYFQRNHLIYIDENLPDNEKTFVCAHELGHMFMHRDKNSAYMDTHTCFNTRKPEIEANTFAAELLIPDEIILENRNMTIEQISRLLGYKQELIKLRLKLYQGV